MTVIAYTNGAIFCDRLHLLETDNIIEKKFLKSKLKINADRTMAFCYTGLEIPDDGLESIFIILMHSVELYMKLKKVITSERCKTESLLSTVLNLEQRQFIIITKDNAFYFCSDYNLILDKDDLVTGGIDGNYFKALALTGMEPIEIIPYIYNNLSNGISREFDTLTHSDLEPLKFIDHILDEDKALNTLKEKYNL